MILETRVNSSFQRKTDRSHCSKDWQPDMKHVTVMANEETILYVFSFIFFPNLQYATKVMRLRDKDLKAALTLIHTSRERKQTARPINLFLKL